MQSQSMDILISNNAVIVCDLRINQEERMALAKVVGFRRDRQKRSASRRPQRRILNAPWQPLAALVGVAGALWFATTAPNVADRNAAFVMNGNGSFALCAGASRRDCVIDGDTIRYRGIKIRLEDIDAPEISSPQCASEAARARRAKQRLLELMNAGPFAVVRTGGRDEDIYGRKLRTIERAGRSLGDVLIAEGLARRWDGARRRWCG
jgi:micrococcal nuclease